MTDLGEIKEKLEGLKMVDYPADVLFKVEVPNMDKNGYTARFCYSMSRGWLFCECENLGWREIDVSQFVHLFKGALKTKYVRENV